MMEVLGTADSTLPLLSVRELVKYFDVSGGAARRLLYGPRTVKAVDGVSFEVGEGETIGLVGESGSGKSTTAKLIARLLPVMSGDVSLAGRDILKASPSEMKALRKDIQFIFQGPFLVPESSHADRDDHRQGIDDPFRPPRRSAARTRRPIA